MVFMVSFMVPDPRSISSRRARKGARSARSAHAVQITPHSQGGCMVVYVQLVSYSGVCAAVTLCRVFC